MHKALPKLINFHREKKFCLETLYILHWLLEISKSLKSLKFSGKSSKVLKISENLTINNAQQKTSTSKQQKGVICVLLATENITTCEGKIQIMSMKYFKHGITWMDKMFLMLRNGWKIDIRKNERMLRATV